ncbi:MAG: EamA family transporter RarD [Propionibacteriaceae bacterium]|nr:EamA family transporter RarD [Propionibacteriaceae bacterium]
MNNKVDRRGLVAAFGAYGLWGVFPLYFHLLSRSSALEIVAHRIWWTLVFCAIGITVMGAWAKVRQVFADRRLFAVLLGAGVLVSLNWLIYIYAVVTDQVVDAALGYFMNPLVTVVIAMFALRERINRAQLVALGVGLAAVLVISIGVGWIPWLGLGLALTFGFYSLAKNKVGRRVTGFIGLGVEALALAPLSGAYIIFLEVTGRGSLTTISVGYASLLIAAGVVTAIPLLCFAVGAARLRLVSLALIQYVTPVMQFLIGVIVFHESMPLVRWIGFILVWIALVVLSWDMARTARRSASAELTQ